MKPAIVVIAYNRPESLKRLLDSIALAHYPGDQIVLHISIDKSTTDDVVAVAEEFNWSYGEKIIQVHYEHLGLKKHVLLCGDLVQKYESIIVLEDDLAVAPDYYNYASTAGDFYKEDSSIAGVSLYRYHFEEASFQSFHPINDGSDVHFIQVASSWGQLWTKDQWLLFKDWLQNRSNSTKVLPDYMNEWGENSWKKLFNAYLIEENKFFVFPNVSLTTNFEEAGTNASYTGLFQVPLQIGRRDYHFTKSNDSRSKYDAYFECWPDCLKSLNPDLRNYSFDVDLYGNKPKNSEVDFRLTSQNSSEYEIGFSSTRRPLIQNVIFNELGDEFGLVEMKKILPESSRNRRVASLPINLRSEIVENLKDLFSFTVVVVSTDNSKLNKTLSTIPKSLSIQIIVVGERLLQEEPGVDYIHFKGEIEEMLKKGIKSSKGNIVSWCVSGDLYLKDAFNSVTSILSTFTNIHWLHGVQEADLQESRLEKANDSLEYTRGTFLKPVIFEKAINSEQGGFQLNTTRSLAVEPFFSIGSEKMSSGNDRETSKTAFRLLQWGFKRKLPIVSTLYRRKAKLPLVIRYDKIHNSYYLNEF